MAKCSKNNKENRKGDNGTVLIIGGSETYTGAPIFTALGALRSGSEIVYIMPSSAANTMLKSLLEAIVLPFDCSEHILQKITCVVIGPGLGRDLSNEQLGCLNKIVEYLDDRAVPFVIDGDGIHYYKQGIFKKVKKLVITPNYLEAQDLQLANDHYGIYKGKNDEIKCKGRSKKVSSKANPKRIAGQGDILSGILATFLSKYDKPMEKVCKKSSKFMRKASYIAFKKYGMSLITSDIFKYFPYVLLRNNKGKIKKLIKKLKSTAPVNK